MPSRIVNRIELTPTAKQHIDELCQVLSMTHVALTSRVIEWFARQDEIALRTIVGHIPPQLHKGLYRLLSKRKNTPKQ